MERNKIKVVEILGCLDRGGIETWLKDIILNYNKEKFQIDFLLTISTPGAYDEIVKKEKSDIKIIPISIGLWKFSYRLYKIFRKEKYDVVHAHPHLFCGYICLIAFLARIPIRISHSHNDTREKQKTASFSKNIYISIMKVFIQLFSTKKLSCSNDAGLALFGKDTNFTILHCGINVSGFQKDDTCLRMEYKQTLNIPLDSICIGHVGSFTKQKNHEFLIEIFMNFHKNNINSFLLLVGVGSLEKEIREKVEKLGLNKSVIFLGARDDVNLLMKYVFNVFLFPSLHEGLGIVLLESQMAGLKCLISDNIPKEAIVIEENMYSMSLQENSNKWANQLYKCLLSQNLVSKESIIRRFNESKFSIEQSARILEQIYSTK